MKKRSAQIFGTPKNFKCSPTSAHKLVLPQMTPFLLAFRLLLYRMARNGECLPVVKQHSRYRKEFLKSLTEEERHLCSRTKIPPASLLSLAKFPWCNLLAPQVNQALITVTGFDGVSFASLLQKFAPLFDDYTPFDTSHIKLSLILQKEVIQGRFARRIVSALFLFGRA
jgi:hypothetical protein